MERRQQERLVGAVVVVLAAAVVVPWLLDGSPEGWAAQGHERPLEAPRTQRRKVDLRNPPAVPVETQPVPTRDAGAAPTPVVSPPALEAIDGTEIDSPALEATAQGEAPAAAMQAERTATPGAQADMPSAAVPLSAPVVPPESPASAAPEPPAPAGVETGWAVQVGSFRNKANAQGLVDTLSRKRYRAFLSRHTRSGVVWYRVRVGTEQTRAAAQDIATRLRREGQVTSVVRHP